MPSKEKFYSLLAGKKISDKDYKHVLMVWDRFEMKAMKYYHNLYLKRDVLLLADVFEKFRNSSLKNCGLFPSHYFSALALSWDAMFNMKKVKLEIISDTGKYLIFEKDMRGGVSYISKRYSKANNKYLNSYDPNQKWKHIIYLDASNLYGDVMSNFFQQIDLNR